MKKNNALRNIIKFIDRKIIFPITKLILAISERFSKSSKVIENWLSKSNTLLFISLIFAVALFIAVDQRKISMRESSAEVLKDVPVIAEYNQESYVIEGLPDKVDVTLIGGKSDLYFAKQSGTQNIVVDLSDLKPGTHKVSINYTQDFRALEYSVNPSTAIISVGSYSQYKMPSEEVLERLRTLNIPYYSTHENGTIIATSKIIVDL